MPTAASAPLPCPSGILFLTVRAPERQLVHVSRPIQPGGEEDLGAIRLEKDVPVAGVVKDEDGAPIPAVTIGATAGHRATTGEDGRFTLRGFGPNPSFQMNVSKTGYVPPSSVGVGHRRRGSVPDPGRGREGPGAGQGSGRDAPAGGLDRGPGGRR